MLYALLATMECRCGFDPARPNGSCGTLIFSREDKDKFTMSHRLGCPALVRELLTYTNERNSVVMSWKVDHDDLGEEKKAALEYLSETRSSKELRRTCAVCTDDFVAPLPGQALCPACTIVLPTMFSWLGTGRQKFLVPEIISNLVPCVRRCSLSGNMSLPPRMVDCLRQLVEEDVCIIAVTTQSLAASALAMVGLMAAECGSRCVSCDKVKGMIVVYDKYDIPAYTVTDWCTAGEGLETGTTFAGSVVSYWPFEQTCIMCGSAPDIRTQGDGDILIFECTADDRNQLLTVSSAVARSLGFAPNKPNRRYKMARNTCDICGSVVVQAVKGGRANVARSFCPIHAQGRAYDDKTIVAARETSPYVGTTVAAVAEMLLAGAKRKNTGTVAIESAIACKNELTYTPGIYH